MPPIPLPTAVPLTYYLILSAILFALGVAGFLFRKSLITVFMSIELMLNAVNLTFVTFSYQHKQVDGHLFTFFVMVVATGTASDRHRFPAAPRPSPARHAATSP